MQVKLNRGENTSEASAAYIVHVARESDNKGVAIVRSGKVNVRRLVVVLECETTQVFVPKCIIAYYVDRSLTLSRLADASPIRWACTRNEEKTGQ